jgi:hypothetical protein
MLAVLGVLTTLQAYRGPAPPSLLGNPDVQSLFSWLKSEEQRSPQRVVFINPRVLTLVTGIPAMAPISTKSRIIAELEKHHITSVILSDLDIPGPGNNVMKELVSETPQRFTLVYQNLRFRVFRFTGPAGNRMASR